MSEPKTRVGVLRKRLAELNAGGHLSDNELITFGALLGASRYVVSLWERGDLAHAVRSLDQVLEERA